MAGSIWHRFREVEIYDLCALRFTWKHIIDSISRVRMISNSKSDFQGHQRLPVIVQFDRPHTRLRICNAFWLAMLRVTVWRSGNALVSNNEVNLRWARLVLGWVTVSGFDSRRRHFISVYNQPRRSTQPSTLRGTVKWVPAKGRWCSANVRVYVFYVFLRFKKYMTFYVFFWNGVSKSRKKSLAKV